MAYWVNNVLLMFPLGIGVGLLPTFMEERHPELVAVSDPVPELAQPVWMLTHPDLRETARVRAFMQHVGDAIAERCGHPHRQVEARILVTAMDCSDQRLPFTDPQ